MEAYKKIYELLTETRSAESRAKTRGKKLFGKTTKQKVSGTKAMTIGMGRRAAHGIARAKLYHDTSKELKSQAKKSAVTKRPTPKSSGILRKSAAVLRKSGERYEKGAQKDIVQGKRLAAQKHYKK